MVVLTSRETDQVEAGKGTPELLHPATAAQGTEIDGEVPSGIEERDDLARRGDAATGDEDDAPAAGLGRIGAEHAGAERIAGLDHAGRGDEIGDDLARC